MRRLDPGLEPRVRTPEPDPYACDRCGALVREEGEPHPCVSPSVYEIVEGCVLRWAAGEITTGDVEEIVARECDDLDGIEVLDDLLREGVSHA
jgi:hypothetical protein